MESYTASRTVVFNGVFGNLHFLVVTGRKKEWWSMDDLCWFPMFVLPNNMEIWMQCDLLISVVYDYMQYHDIAVLIWIYQLSIPILSIHRSISSDLFVYLFVSIQEDPIPEYPQCYSMLIGMLVQQSKPKPSRECFDLFASRWSKSQELRWIHIFHRQRQLLDRCWVFHGVSPTAELGLNLTWRLNEAQVLQEHDGTCQCHDL